ncbi:hypothetical protein BT67DRAFT_87382 [Trichocladium antarcticum]|uniref:Clock-controlled pheromone ccg-4 n=1 Tax=Trichocladium antarcticum TaxID=1450529 RepID=A0AAN6UG40_9PEZI|nr:hypothetical protein BT67DRAFT_87382 [Trichocladium antarcticum]
MKYTLPITLLAIAASADAAAVKEEDKRWCSLNGQACDTVRRAADAFANTIKSTSGIAARDESSSETAFIARRQIDELALAIAASQADPIAFYAGVNFGQHSAAGQAAGGEKTTKREAGPQGWCSRFPGQPCWKREADAVDAEKRDAEAQGWCSRFPGQPCWKRDFHPAKRSGTGWCAREAGQPCWARSVDQQEFTKRDAEAEAQGWCSRFPGQPCWKREAGADADADADADAEAQGWCSRFPGQPCWKRDFSPAVRAAEPQHCTRFVGSSCWKRDASPEATEDHKRCTGEGQSCWKAKRAAEAVVSAIETGNTLFANFDKREAEAQGWCSRFPGQPCWKRAAAAEADCNGPAGACTRATRDLHAMYNAARSILEAN